MDTILDIILVLYLELLWLKICNIVNIFQVTLSNISSYLKRFLLVIDTPEHSSWIYRLIKWFSLSLEFPELLHFPSHVRDQVTRCQLWSVQYIKKQTEIQVLIYIIWNSKRSKYYKSLLVYGLSGWLTSGERWVLLVLLVWNCLEILRTTTFYNQTDDWWRLPRAVWHYNRHT